MNQRRLVLERVDNVRDLGGYPIGEKGITKWQCFLRSADLADISDGDKDLLYDYGVRTVINLKAVGETDNPIETDKRFLYRHVPLFDNFEILADDAKDYGGNISMAVLHVFTPRIKDIFHIIAERIDSGGVLFHCLAGKDRTGLIAVLLLLLAGVSKLDILADYMTSLFYVRPVVQRLHKSKDDIHINPDEIEETIAEIESRFHGIERYFRDIGVSLDDIEKIKARFIMNP